MRLSDERWDLTICGVRVEPGEIEAALEAHPAVRQVAVTVREDTPGDRRLVAYVVPVARFDPAALHAHVAGLLPAHLAPSVFILLERPSLTPGFDPRPLAATEPGRAPATAREENLCAMYADVLGRPRVGADDDFFALGGTSLLAARLALRIRAAFGIRLPIRAVVDTPVVADLALRLETPPPIVPSTSPPPVSPEVSSAAYPTEPPVASPAGTRAVSPAVSSAVSPGASRAVCPVVRPRPSRPPLSWSQHRPWLDRGAEPTGIPLVYRLSGPLDTGVLGDALRDVIARHEALRTVLPDLDGARYQRVLVADRVGLPVIRCTRRTVDRLVRLWDSVRFDPGTDLPVRAALFAVRTDEYVFFCKIYDSAADGPSTEVLRRDLAAAYTARLAGDEPHWHPLPLQYADFAGWQRETLGEPDDPSSEIALQLGHWRSTLAGLPAEVTVPPDRPRTDTPTTRTARVDFEIAPESHERAANLARGSGTTVFMVLQAALAALLTGLGAGEDVPIGTPVPGREAAGLENLVGCFGNVVVLRTDTSGDPSLAELLSRVRSVAAAAHANQDAPFAMVAAESAPGGHAHPLFQVFLETGGDVGFRLPGVRAEEHRDTATPFPYDLSLGFRERNRSAGIACSFRYATDLYDESTVEDLAERLTTLLRHAVSAPHVALSRLDTAIAPVG